MTDVLTRRRNESTEKRPREKTDVNGPMAKMATYKPWRENGTDPSLEGTNPAHILVLGLLASKTERQSIAVLKAS